MVVLGVIAALLVLLLGAVLWATLRAIRSEVATSVASLERATMAMGKVSLQSERASEHIERVAKIRLRRMLVSRLLHRFSSSRT